MNHPETAILSCNSFWMQAKVLFLQLGETATYRLSLSHHRCPPAGAAGDRSLPVITASTGVHLTLTELTQSAPLLRAVCFLETSCVPTFNLSQQLKRTCGEEVTLNKITSLFIKRQNVSCFTLCNCCLPKNTPVRRAAIFSQFSVVFLQMPG